MSEQVSGMIRGEREKNAGPKQSACIMVFDTGVIFIELSLILGTVFINSLRINNVTL